MKIRVRFVLEKGFVSNVSLLFPRIKPPRVGGPRLESGSEEQMAQGLVSFPVEMR